MKIDLFDIKNILKSIKWNPLFPTTVKLNDRIEKYTKDTIKLIFILVNFDTIQEVIT